MEDVDSADDSSISGDSTATSVQSCEAGGKSFPMRNSRDVYCRLPSDRVPCRITCLTVLADGDLVVYDGGNFKLKAFDSLSYFIGARNDVYNCRGITSVSGKKIAITQEDKTAISLYSIKGRSIMPKDKEIPLPGNGYHCKYVRKHFAITCDITDAGSRSLIIIDSSKRSIITCKKLPTISVSQLAMNPDNDVVYIADDTHKTITCINFGGDTIWVQDLSWVPCGMSVVINRYLFVCNMNTKTLFKFETETKLWEEMADFKCIGPICYNAKGGVLYVNLPANGDEEGKNKVHVLKIDNKKLKRL
jgi:hypothetical protein